MSTTNPSGGSSYGQILKSSSIIGGGEAATQGGGWECEVSVDSVADALVALMSCSESELADYERSARKLVDQNYTWDKLARDLHVCCRQALV